MKNHFKFASLLASFTLILTLFSIPVNAKELGKQNVTKEKRLSVTYMKDANDNNKLISKFKKEALYDGMYDENGKLQKLDKQKLKAGLLKKWEKEPIKYSDNIANIDTIVSSMMAQVDDNSILQNQITTQGLFSTYYWFTEPYVYQTEDWISWNSWITENNYLSSVSISVSSTKSSTAETKLGFSGDSEVKVRLGLSWEYTKSQTSTLTVGTTVPAWTIWGRRPYIEYRKDFWKGTQAEEWYDLIKGGWATTFRTKTGINKVLTNSATQYWDSVNSSHNRNLASPEPPSGMPNV